MSRTQGRASHLFDPLYAQGSVLDRCQRAIHQAQSTAHANRFSLEMDQVTNLQKLLNQDLTTVLQQAPSTATELLNHLAQPQTDWRQSTNALSPEQATQAGVPKNTTVFLGHKYFYIMPQSAIHDGEMSMYLVAQPAYIPITNQWVVLQEQLFAVIPWETHSKALSRAKNQQEFGGEDIHQTPADPTLHSTENAKHQQASLPNFSEPAVHTKLTEAQIMSQCIELPASSQLENPRETLLQLLAETSTDILKTHERIKKEHAELTANLALHAEYLLTIQELDDTWEQGWGEQKAARLSQALFNTLSSIYHKKLVTPAQTNTWVQEYTQLYSTARNRSKASELADTLRRATSQSTPWLAESITSKLECFSVSATKLTLQQVGQTGFQQLNLSAAENLFSNPEAQQALKTALAEFSPLSFANGEIWYIPKEHFAVYAKGCYLKGGVVFGPCDIPLTQDNLVLSEETYQALEQQYLQSQEAALNQHKTAAHKHLFSSLTSPQEQAEALELLKLIEEEVLVTSLGLQQFISGEVISLKRLAHIPELLAYYNQLLLSADPLEALRQIVLQIVGSRPKQWENHSKHTGREFVFSAGNLSTTKNDGENNTKQRAKMNTRSQEHILFAA